VILTGGVNPFLPRSTGRVFSIQPMMADGDGGGAIVSRPVIWSMS